MSFDQIQVGPSPSLGGMELNQSVLAIGPTTNVVNVINMDNRLPAMGGGPVVAYDLDQKFLAFQIGDATHDGSIGIINQSATPGPDAQVLIASASAPLRIIPGTGGLLNGVLTDVDGSGTVQWRSGGGGGGGSPSVGPVYALNTANGGGGWVDSNTRIDASQNMTNVGSIAGKTGVGLTLSTSGGDPITIQSAGGSTMNMTSDGDVSVAGATGATVKSAAGDVALLPAAGSAVSVGNLTAPNAYRLTTASPSGTGQALVSTSAGVGASVGWGAVARSQGVNFALNVSDGLGGFQDSGVLLTNGQVMSNMLLIEGQTGGLYLQAPGPGPLNITGGGGCNLEIIGDLTAALVANGETTVASHGSNVNLTPGDSAALAIGTDSSPGNWQLVTSSPPAGGMVLTSLGGGAGAQTGWVTPSTEAPVFTPTFYPATPITITPAAIQGGIIVDTVGTAAVWNLSTGADYHTFFGEAAVGAGHICHVYKTDLNEIVINGNTGITLSGLNPITTPTTLILVYVGGNNYTAFF